MPPRKKQRERNAAITKATDRRKAHFEKVARSLGCGSAKEAMNQYGKDFINLAQKGAPSINKALNDKSS